MSELFETTCADYMRTCTLAAIVTRALFKLLVDSSAEQELIRFGYISYDKICMHMMNMHRPLPPG